MKKYLSIALVFIVSLCLFSCGSSSSSSNSSGLKKITVACTPIPHAEIMNNIKGMMKDKGFELEVKEFTDYVLPNLAVDQGEVDANFFQHKPYLDEFNDERGTKVVSIVPVHYEPFGIYAGKKSVLEVSDGDKIAVPNDVTNEARSLNLLESAGVIKLKEGVGLKATKLDIALNPHNIEIVELESAQIPRALDSVSFACMNGNYAMEAGFKVSDALYIEEQTSKAATLYANIVCVKEGNENADFAIALKECVKSKSVKDFIEKTYDKSVIFMD